MLVSTRARHLCRTPASSERDAPNRLAPERSPAKCLAVALILIFASSCSTLITKTNAPLWPGRRYTASGLGHAFTGLRCEPMYFVGCVLYTPALPLIPLVVADIPLSAIADALIL